jgi:uncharacterized membrane protein
MTERDREATLAKYNKLFDEAINEDDVIAQLGSPTRIAIAELRGYVPSAEPEPADSDVPETECTRAAVPDAQAAAGGLIEPEPMPEALTDSPAPETAGTEADLDALCLPDLSEIEAVVADIEFGGSETPEPGQVSETDAAPESSGAPEAPRRRANGGRLTLYILFGVLLCIPAAVLLIALSLGFLALGAGLVAAGVFTISLGFIGIAVFADIMLLLGAGLIVAAIGVPFVFLAVWFFVRAAVGFINLILRTGGKWCYAQAGEARQ